MATSPDSRPLARLRPSLKAYLDLRAIPYFVLALLALTAVLGWQNGLGRVDLLIYDQLIAMTGRPANADVLIVAIDDASLAALGRWPWPLTRHAELIDRIDAASPRTIGLDISLDDATPAQESTTNVLRDAVRRSGKVVVPVMAKSTQSDTTMTLSPAQIKDAAAGSGHTTVLIDADGVVRSARRDVSAGGQQWPQFAQQMQALGGRRGDAAPALPAFANQPSAAEVPPVLIPYAGRRGHFSSVSYAAVLRGDVPAAALKNKYILIGTTAANLAEAYPTPVSNQTGTMPSVEIHANQLAALLDGRSITAVAAWQSALLSCIPVSLALLSCFFFSPRAGLFAFAGLLALTGLSALLGLRFGYWMAPSAAMLALLLGYPIWSWRRLEAAIGYLKEEYARLDGEPHLLPPERQHRTGPADQLGQEIEALKSAASRVRALRQFVSSSLHSLPDATLVTTLDGYVLLANQSALDYFASVGFSQVQGALLPYLFTTPSQTQPQSFDHTIETHFNWWDLLDPMQATTFREGVGFRNQAGVELLVRSAPCRTETGMLIGWIISIIDISPVRQAERLRDESLRFLSHDMRGPQASILALLELQANPASALPQAEFFSRIEKASRKTLGLADNFVQLARAESAEYRLEEIDFHDLVVDATDEIWSLASSKHIAVRSDVSPESLLALVDRGLMTRALTNLLSNAIQYSASGTTIFWSVHPRNGPAGKEIICSITDQGYGIAAADQTRLFRRFQRVDVPGQPRHDGTGIGLLFVKTVIERHQGDIRFASKLGVGTTFTLTLPRQITAR